MWDSWFCTQWDQELETQLINDERNKRERDQTNIRVSPSHQKTDLLDWKLQKFLCVALRLSLTEYTKPKYHEKWYPQCRSGFHFGIWTPLKHPVLKIIQKEKEKKKMWIPPFRRVWLLHPYTPYSLIVRLLQLICSLKNWQVKARKNKFLSLSLHRGASRLSAWAPSFCSIHHLSGPDYQISTEVQHIDVSPRFVLSVSLNQ